jgi:hypothetical protein
VKKRDENEVRVRIRVRIRDYKEWKREGRIMKNR